MRYGLTIRLLAGLLASAPAWSAVSILGTPANVAGGGTYTAESGADLVVIACARSVFNGGPATVTALSLGSASLANSHITQAVTAVNTTADYVRSSIWYIKQVDIPAGSNTLTVTWSQTMLDSETCTLFSLAGVDQTTPVDATDSMVQDTAADPWSDSYTVADGSVQIASGANTNFSASDPPAGWTEFRDQNGSDIRRQVHYKVTTTGGSTAWGADFAATSHGAMVTASFAAASGGGGGDPPAFTSGPTLGTPTTSTLPTTFTVDSDADVYGVACPDGQTAPTASQVLAGDCTADADAEAAFVEAVTATVSDGETFTGLDDDTTYDLYFVASNGDGESDVESIADAQTAASGGGGCAGFTPDSGWACSGTFANGQIVSVTHGAGGLGLRSDERPLLWIPGETSGAKDSTYSRSSQTMVLQNNAAIDSSHHPANAMGSIRQSWPISGGTQAFFSNDPVWSFSTNQVYVSVKRMHDFVPTGSPDVNDKEWRLWPTAFGAPDVYSKNYDGGSAVIVEGYTNSNDAMSSGNRFFQINHQANVWYQDEHVFQESSDNAFDGFVRRYRNAARSHPESIGWKTRNSSGEPGAAVKTQGYLDQYSNPDTSGMNDGDKHENIAHIYITDTVARFFVSSESSQTNVTMNGSNDPGIFREVQLPTGENCGDTGCELLLRKGVYSSLSGLYLWFAPPDGGAFIRIGQFAEGEPEPPTFSAGPALGTPTTTTLPTTFTTDQAATVYGVACPDGQTAPTAAQVLAGDCTGDIAAESAWSEATAGTVPDGHTFTGLTAETTYDLHFVASNANGDSSVTSIADAETAAEEFDCPANKQCVTLASVSATSWCHDVNESGIDPAIAAGDIVVIDEATTPGSFAWTQSTDCNGSYSGDASRQSLEYSIWDASAEDYMDGSPANLWFNNQAPVGDSTISILLAVGEAFSIDLCAAFIDPEGDTLTGSNSSGGTGTGEDHHPAGSSFGGTGNCRLSGELSTTGSGSFTFTVTDVAGAQASALVDWQAIEDSATVPDCTTEHLELGACLDLLSAAFLSGGSVTLEYSDTVAAGRVISQDPAAESEVDIFSEVDLVVSRGLAIRGKNRGIGVAIGVGIN